MRDVGIVETAHHVHDCVHFPYVRKELVSKPFALACALDKTCDIHKFKRRGSDFFAVVKSGEFFKSFVGDGNDAYVWFYRAERIVCSLRSCLCDCVEKRALADVRQTYDTEFHISPDCTFLRA